MSALSRLANILSTEDKYVLIIVQLSGIVVIYQT